MLGSRNEAVLAPAFLRLPLGIRHRIYHFVGLASWNGSPKTFDLHGGHSGSDTVCRARFHGLLLACRDIYAEAATLLYSANRFVVRYTDPGSLNPLLALTAPALSSLARLKVVLNQASCHHRTQSNHELDCCRHGSSTLDCSEPYHSHQPQLLSSARDTEDDNNNPPRIAQALLGEWHAAASYLSSHTTSRFLELSVVCDIDSGHKMAVDLAKSVLEPLCLFPSLKSCHIRLCQTSDIPLRQAAEDAVLQSCGIAAPYRKPSSSKQKIAFLTLPRELRLRILEFTDLVTPSKEVWWCRSTGIYEWADVGGGDSDCLDNNQYPSNCRFLECWYRTHAHTLTGDGLHIGCFCRRHHGAFSATCTCWVPPGPALFLVCRTLCEDARLVFFSANRFVVHDLDIFPPDRLRKLRGDYPYERLAASQFLRQVIPTHCIAYLRFLELVFPLYLPETWPQADHPAVRDWRETVSWLRDVINGPALTLRLVGVGSLHRAPWPNPTIMATQGDMIHSAYMGILQALKPLAEGPNGLAKFYADLPYPWHWTDEEQRRRQDEDGQDWSRARKRELKWSAEHQVIGGRYDNQYSNDKEEPEQSLWQHAFVHHVW